MWYIVAAVGGFVIGVYRVEIANWVKAKYKEHKEG
jgi:hypothetical protein